MRIRKAQFGGILLALLTAVPGSAASFTLNLQSGGGTTSSSTGSGFGNAFTFQDGIFSVTITGVGLTGNNGTTLQTAEIGQYGGGLGICNQSEGADCSSPSHQADNAGQFEFFLLRFNQPVSSATFSIAPAGNYDRDVSYWQGGLINPASLLGSTLANLNTIGLTGPVHNNSTVAFAQRSFTVALNDACTVLLGARVGPNADQYTDRFKFQSILAVVDPRPGSETPEPGTWVMLAGGLLAIALSRYRRQ